MQIRYMDPLPPLGCVIIDEDLSNQNAYNITLEKSLDKSHYDKYFKMIAMGIPLEAVKIKCKLDGLDSNFIDTGKETIKKGVHRPQLNDMKNIKLKKTIIVPKKKDTYRHKNQFGPTLDDIQKQLNSLKKINN